jgi:hypothetical protein
MGATDPAQDHARVGGHRQFVGLRCRKRLVAQQQPLLAIHEHGVADTQHRHASHRPPVDMQTAHPLAHLQPHAPAIDTELRDRLFDIGHDHRAVDDVAADRMHARTQDQVGLLTVGESQSDGIHAAGI